MKNKCEDCNDKYTPDSMTLLNLFYCKKHMYIFTGDKTERECWCGFQATTKSSSVLHYILTQHEQD